MAEERAIVTSAELQQIVMEAIRGLAGTDHLEAVAVTWPTNENWDVALQRNGAVATGSPAVSAKIAELKRLYRIER